MKARTKSKKMTSGWRKSIIALTNLCVCLGGFIPAASSLATDPPEFTEHVIKDDYNYAYGVSAGDLDGDGDIDLASPNVRGAVQQSDLYWFENDGNGAFQSHLAYQDETGWLERNALGDISGDGRLDAVVVENRDGSVVWYENNSQPEAGLWQRHVVTTEAPRAYDVALADFNGDQWLDVAVAGYASNQISWYVNPATPGWGQNWNKITLDTTMSEARTIRAGDFNGDGRIDLLAAAAGASDVPVPAPPASHNSQVIWYENTGHVTPWIKHTVDTASRAPIHGEPVDMDGDTDLDIVMAFGMRSALVPEEYHEVAWYENSDGTGLSWDRYTIGALPYAFEAISGDLDRDGDMDVIASAWAYGDTVVWFENLGDPSAAWDMHTVKFPWNAANQVIVADLNGDGWMDIAGTADDGSSQVVGANDLIWWENRAIPEPGTLALMLAGVVLLPRRKKLSAVVRDAVLRSRA